MSEAVLSQRELPETETPILNRGGPTVSRVQSIEEFIGLPQPHTPEQELQHFGDWVGDPIWVPPKDNSGELAKSMLNRFCLLYTSPSPRDRQKSRMPSSA